MSIAKGKKIGENTLIKVGGEHKTQARPNR